MIQPNERILDGAARLGVRLEAMERALNEMDSRVLGYRAAKLCVPILLCGVAALAIGTLWRVPLLLAGALIAIAFVKHKLFPIRFEWIAFCGVAILGAYAESGIIIASGAWHYADAQIAQIPIWLPAIWGLVGISLMTAYSAIVERIPQSGK